MKRIENKTLAVAGAAAIFVSCLVVWAVAVIATEQRSSDAIAASQKYLSTQASTVARMVPVSGSAVVPPQSETQVFGTYDIYITDGKGVFLTSPRFSAIGGHSSPDRYNAAWGEGKTVTGEWLDYRGVPVVGAARQTLLDGKRAVVVVEIDRSEVASIAWKPWYLVREAGVPALLLLGGWCGWMLYKSAEKGRIASAVADASGVDYGKFFNQFVRSFPDGGIVLVDADGKIVECNTEFARMDGKLSARELIGTSVHRFHPEGVAHHAGLFASFSEDLTLRPVTAILDGKQATIFLSVTRFNGWFVARITHREAKRG